MGMRRTTLLIASVLLAVPAVAHAKVGVIFDQYPETVKVGAPIGFTVMASRDLPAADGGTRPLRGAHPLVTFRSRSGRVIRVRTKRTDLNGIGHGRVSFTDKGPWTSEVNARSLHGGSGRSEPFEVGIGLTQTIPSADETAAAAAARDAPASHAGFPWVWVLSGTSILAALAVAGMRRRGHWGTA
jgi:hypothetical protein